MTVKYELAFEGEETYEPSLRLRKFPRYRKLHRTLESAQQTAERVREVFRAVDVNPYCYRPQIYGGPEKLSTIPW